MVQTGDEVVDFSYDDAGGVGRDAAGLPATVTIFSDNSRLCSQMAWDLNGAGIRAIKGGEIARLIDGPVTRLGDVVLVDCAVSDGSGLDAATLAALARLDMRIARSGAELVVFTSMEALDDVFGVLDQSRAQILVRPTRGERIVAVGRVLANVSNARVREMNEEDRLCLLRLAEQVEAIAKEIDRISAPDAQGTERLRDFKRGFAPASNDPVSLSQLPNRSQPPALPDPQAVRQMIAARHARSRFFDSELFADPAWDMMLDLTTAHGEKAQVSVTSLCIASGVPATTALRWLKQMVDCGIFVRVADPNDRRRAFIELSENSLDAMARYFQTIETPLARAA